MKEEIFYECVRHCQEQAGQIFFLRRREKKIKKGGISQEKRLTGSQKDAAMEINGYRVKRLLG